jgi:hypothetical protein
MQVHVFLTSTLVGGEWLALPTEKESPVGPRTGLDDLKKRKFLILPGRPARSQSLNRLRYPSSFAKPFRGIYVDT